MMCHPAGLAPRAGQRDALPRRWPPPGAAFAWWAREDERAHYQRLARLGSDELKFVIDVPRLLTSSRGRKKRCVPLTNFAEITPWFTTGWIGSKPDHGLAGVGLPL